MPRNHKAPSLAAIDGSYRSKPSRTKVALPVSKTRPLPPITVQADEVAVAVWNETCDALEGMGVLCIEDTALLQLYCLNKSMLLSEIKSIQVNGSVDYSADGSTKSSGHSNNYQRLAKLDMQLMRELGLTPNSRVKAPVEQSNGMGKQLDCIARLMRGDNKSSN